MIPYELQRERVSLLTYLAIARPKYWLRNVFILPGAALAALITATPVARFGWVLLLAIASACLISSANYVINEWLDADSDRFHPVKKLRPAVAGLVKPGWVYLEYTLLLLAGLGLAYLVSPAVLLLALTLALMGFFYNVKPFRTKERVYLDVLSESINNPIRLAIGWLVVTSQPLPPLTLVLGYWMFGAFLMSMKRFAEYRFIGDPQQAGLYRRSFQVYSETSLLVSSLFYANAAACLLGVFLVRLRAELVLSLPFLALLLAWYFYIGLKPNSPAQHPEHLISEKPFLAYVLSFLALVALLHQLHLPWFR